VRRSRKTSRAQTVSINRIHRVGLAAEIVNKQVRDENDGKGKRETAERGLPEDI
jgi:hypothetical protein